MGTPFWLKTRNFLNCVLRGWQPLSSSWALGMLLTLGKQEWEVPLSMSAVGCFEGIQERCLPSSGLWGCQSKSMCSRHL